MRLVSLLSGHTTFILVAFFALGTLTFWKTRHPLTNTLANSEGTDEMQHLSRSTQLAKYRKKYNSFFLEIINYVLYHPPPPYIQWTNPT